MHALLAEVYSIPFVSARNALYSLMWDDAALTAATGFTKRQLMQDEIHPTALGQALYGRGLMAYAMQRMLARELRVMANGDAAGGLPDGTLFDCDGAGAPAVVPGGATGAAVDAAIRPVSPLASQEADGVSALCVLLHGDIDSTLAVTGCVCFVSGQACRVSLAAIEVHMM